MLDGVDVMSPFGAHKNISTINYSAIVYTYIFFVFICFNIRGLPKIILSFSVTVSYTHLTLPTKRIV